MSRCENEVCCSAAKFLMVGNDIPRYRMTSASYCCQWIFSFREIDFSEAWLPADCLSLRPVADLIVEPTRTEDLNANPQPRTASRCLRHGVGRQPTLEGRHSLLQCRRCRSSARLGAARAYAGPTRRAKALEPREYRAFRRHARRTHRQP